MVGFEKGEGEAWYEGVEIGVALVGSNSPCTVCASQVGRDNDPGVCPKMFPPALDVVRKSRRSKWAALKLEARCKAQTAGNWKQVRIVVACGRQSQKMVINCRIGYKASIHRLTEHE